MRRKMARMKQTTARQDFIGILEETYLVSTHKEARAALQVTCAALRVWILAMTQAPPTLVEAALGIPGVGTLSVCWYEYGGKFAPRVKLRFRPNKDITRQIRRVNREAQNEWKAANKRKIDSAGEPKQGVLEDSSTDGDPVG